MQPNFSEHMRANFSTKGNMQCHFRYAHSLILNLMLQCAALGNMSGITLPRFLHHTIKILSFGIFQKRLVAFFFRNKSILILVLLFDGFFLLRGFLGFVSFQLLSRSTFGFSYDFLVACMLRMLLVIEGAFFRFELRTDLINDDVPDVVDRFFVRTVAVPDCDEVGVEARGESDATDVVACSALSTKLATLAMI